MTDRPAERTGGPVASRGREDTAVRPVTQRLQAKLADAAEAARRTTKSAKPSGSTGSSRASSTKRSPKAPRRARLRLTRVDPWSVMKMAFLLSVAIGVVTVVAVLVVWSVLSMAGVWDSINASVQDIVGDQSTWNIHDYLGTSRVLGFTLVIAVVDVVLLTAVATLGAFLYNMAANLLGGVEITLTEDD